MIHKISKWQKNNQTVYCLSDFHTAVQPQNLINNQQRAVIAQAAQSHDAHVIVEDALRHFDLEPSHQQLYAMPHLRLMQLTPNQASLLGLSSLCYHAGISHKNVEFRLGPTAVYNNGHAASRVLAHTQEAIERIKNYDDGTVANEWYKKIIDEYDQFSNGPAHYFLQELHKKGNEPISRALLESIPYSPEIQKALEQLKPEFNWSKVDQYSQKLVLLMLFDNKLVDAELVHALMQSKNKQAVFICAGNDHIIRFSAILEKLGYKKILSKGNDLVAQDIRYQEPDAIPTNELLSLLEAKEEKLPLLVRTNLYIQLLLDKNNAHGWIAFILGFTLNIISIAAISLASLFSGVSIALWIKAFAGILFGNLTTWYLAQPIKK